MPPVPVPNAVMYVPLVSEVELSINIPTVILSPDSMAVTVMVVVAIEPVKVATADVGTTLQFSLTEVLGDGTNTPTMDVTGLVNKDYGTETLNAYFNVKSNYSYAKIEANDNFVSVTNGDLATTIKVYLNNTQINVGDESFGINQTRNFAPSTTMYATYASEFKDTAFYVKLEVARVNTGFGWYAKVQEVKLKFRYFTLNYDDGIT